MTTTTTRALADDPADISRQLLARILDATSALHSAIADCEAFNATLGTSARGGDPDTLGDTRLDDLIGRTRLAHIFDVLDWAAARLRDVEGVEELDAAGTFQELLEQIGASVGHGGVILLNPTRHG